MEAERQQAFEELRMLGIKAIADSEPRAVAGGVEMLFPSCVRT